MICFRRECFLGIFIAEQVFFFFSGTDSHFTCQILLLLQLLFEFLQFGHWMVGRNGHPRNLGQTTGRGPGNGRVPAVQEELSVINDPSSWRRDRTYITATNQTARKTYLHSRLQGTMCTGKKHNKMCDSEEDFLNSNYNLTKQI